jgi:hypothetical protein
MQYINGLGIALMRLSWLERERERMEQLLLSLKKIDGA